MNCPEHLVFKWWRILLWMYWRDVPRHTIPLKIWLNPLRYQLTIRLWPGKVLRLNQHGRAALAFANWKYRTFGKGRK